MSEWHDPTNQPGDRLTYREPTAQPTPQGRWHWDGHIGRFSQIKNGVVIHKWPDEMDKYASALEAEVAALRRGSEHTPNQVLMNELRRLEELHEHHLALLQKERAEVAALREQITLQQFQLNALADYDAAQKAQP